MYRFKYYYKNGIIKLSENSYSDIAKSDDEIRQLTKNDNFKPSENDRKDFTNYLLNISNEDINKLNNNQLSININNTLYDITKDMIDIKISSKEGYDVSTVNNLFVILNTNLDKNLINEGLARETVSKIQNLRKTSGFDIEDRINIYMNATLEYQNDIKNYIDMVKDDTLCINLVFDNDIKDNQLNINDYVVYVKLEKNEK